MIFPVLDYLAIGKNKHTQRYDYRFVVAENKTSECSITE